MSNHGSGRPASTHEGSVVEQPSFWEADAIPSEYSVLFQNYVHRHLETPNLKDEIFQPKEGQISNWSDAPNSECYASFGDDGVTATVNAYGDLMQFSSFLGVGHSGVFSADHSNTDEPYWVRDRAEQLLNMRRDRRREYIGYGLRLPGINLERCRTEHVGYVHDRWPRYELEDEQLKLTMQWMVHERTVLQQCLITNNGTDKVEVPVQFAKAMHIRDLDHLDMHYKYNEPDGQIQQFQSLAPNGYGWVLVHPFAGKNEDIESQDEAEPIRSDSTSPGFDPIEKKLEEPTEDRIVDVPDAVAVVVSVFINGEAVKWKSDNLNNRNGTVTELLVGNLSSKATIEVTTAYKFVHLIKSVAEWEEFLIPPAWADVGKHLGSASFTAFRLPERKKPAEDSNKKNSEGFFSHLQRSHPLTKYTQLNGLPENSSLDHTEFVIRRNLEHILSTCALPVERPSEAGRIVSVALTCGDVSGHRVCSSASFFAFLFLLEIRKCLNAIGKFDSNHPYEPLKQRIDLVCRGHLKWLSEADLTGDHVFGANYWATGRLIPSYPDTDSFIPSNSFIDTPFHLMKASEFANVYEGEDDQGLSHLVIQKVAKAWIGTLSKSDKRASHVWPHAQDEGCNKYRLNEHVWIWRALQAIENDRRESPDTNNVPIDGGEAHGNVPKNVREAQKDNDKGQRNPDTTDEEKLFRQFSPDTIQRDILRRFTVENDVSKKRMLATTRSSRETRFLLHASDTALFYGMKWNFFLQKLVDEVWDNTVEAQVHHNENSETGWDNSIRYALAIMMGTMDMSLNKKLPKDLAKSAFGVLFRSTSPNGLFYGQLDGTTKEPALFGREQDRDFYFHASFEIPYILLMHCWEIESILQEVSEKDTKPSTGHTKTKTTAPQVMDEMVERLQQQPKRQEHRSPATQPLAVETVDTQDPSSGLYLGGKPKRPKAIAMKKSVPFSSLIDQSSIVDLEEEWLYNYPYFLGNTECAPEGFLKAADDLLKPAESNRSGTVVTKAAGDYMDYVKEAEQHRKSHQNAEFAPVPDPFFKSYSNEAWVIDIRKQKNLSKRERALRAEPARIRYNYELWDILSKPRTAEIAKKRFIWLLGADTDSALICYISSPPDEQPAMSHFFDCHSQYENKFIEETTMVLNTWKSELHLSFYRLVDRKCVQYQGIPALILKEVPGNTDKRLARASMGFRFSGDFFDRYWTCHLIEFTPGYGKPEGADKEKPWDDQSWRQRKVLELYLFDRILKEIVRSTKDIFDMVINELGDNRGIISFSTISSVDYFSSSAKWQNCQQLLQVVEQELTDVLSTISQWERREKDRGQERPRWTRNDERKYRGFIGKLQAATSSSIRELQNCRNKIRSQKEQLISNQQQSRDTLSLIDAENVRLFTYVTVVFLPIGFAASIFSMSETPPRDVVRPMVICSVIALALTIVALVNAKKVLTAINKYSHEKMNSNQRSTVREMHDNEPRRSPMDQEQGEVRESEQGREHDIPGASHQENHFSSFSGHFWFWVVYLFVDLPAQKVSLAFDVLDDESPGHWISYIHVIVGFTILPMLLLSRLFQHFIYNAVDLGQLAWGRCKIFVKSAKPKRRDLDRHWLTNTTRIHRPLEKKVVELKDELFKLQSDSRQIVAGDHSSPEKGMTN